MGNRLIGHSGANISKIPVVGGEGDFSIEGHGIEEQIIGGQVIEGKAISIGDGVPSPFIRQSDVAWVGDGLGLEQSFDVLLGQIRDKMRKSIRGALSGYADLSEAQIAGIADNIINKASGSYEELILSQRDRIIAQNSGLIDLSAQLKEKEALHSLVLGITEASNEKLGMKEMIAKIREILGEMIDVSNFYVALYDSESGTYSFPYFIDTKDDNMDAYDGDRLEGSLTDYVRRLGEQAFIDRGKATELEEKGEISGLIGTESNGWLGAPLKTDNGVFGVIVIQDYEKEDAYSSDELRLFRMAATIVAKAIEKKRDREELENKNEELEKLSITDELTKVFNLRYLNRILKNEFARSERFGHDCSVIMIDVDDFKAVNDTHGHAVGDEVLKGIAALITSCVRETDVVARKGGDEFVVVLPETSIKGAQKVAEKIQGALANIRDFEASKNELITQEEQELLDRLLRFKEIVKEKELNVSFSQGVSSRDSFIANMNEESGVLSTGNMLKVADQAMYSAKRAGKQCIRLGTEKQKKAESEGMYGEGFGPISVSLSSRS